MPAYSERADEEVPGVRDRVDVVGEVPRHRVAGLEGAARVVERGEEQLDRREDEEDAPARACPGPAAASPTRGAGRSRRRRSRAGRPAAGRGLRHSSSSGVTCRPWRPAWRRAGRRARATRQVDLVAVAERRALAGVLLEDHAAPGPTASRTRYWVLTPTKLTSVIRAAGEHVGAGRGRPHRSAPAKIFSGRTPSQPLPPVGVRALGRVTPTFWPWQSTHDGRRRRCR